MASVTPIAKTVIVGGATNPAAVAEAIRVARRNHPESTIKRETEGDNVVLLIMPAARRHMTRRGISLLVLVAMLFVVGCGSWSGEVEVDRETGKQVWRVKYRGEERTISSDHTTATPAATPRRTASSDFNRDMERAYRAGAEGRWTDAQDACADAAISAGLADQNGTTSERDAVARRADNAD